MKRNLCAGIYVFFFVASFYLGVSSALYIDARIVQVISRIHKYISRVIYRQKLYDTHIKSIVYEGFFLAPAHTFSFAARRRKILLFKLSDQSIILC